MLLLIGFAAHAQTESLFQEQDTLLQKRKFEEFDSLERAFKQQSESIKEIYTGRAQKLAFLKQRYRQRIDSIKNNRLATPGNPLDTLNMQTEDLRYMQKSDSIDQQLASIQRKTTDKLDSLKGKVSEKMHGLKLPKGAEGKVNGLTQAMDKVNLPAFNSDLATQAGLNNTISLPNLSGNVPSIDLPDTNLPAMPGVNGNVPGTDVKTPDVMGNLPAKKLPAEKLTDLTGKADNVQQQVKGATASQEAMGNALEGKAAEQLKGLPDQKLPHVAGLPDGIPKTGDEAKEQLVNMAKKEAVNHFAGKEAALTGAMDKMSKYKQKYSSVSSLKDIKEGKRQNPLKGKPVRERLVPALTMQFQSWQDFMLDFNPSIGYKLNPKILLGLGWNQRIAFNINDQQFNRKSFVHGVRSYGEYTFKKGFGVRMDLECMNTPLRRPDVSTDTSPQRDWVWSALVGVKQKYPIYKKLKGNAQVMYNIFDKDHRSPYTDRINWRIGLEFTLKKKASAQK